MSSEPIYLTKEQTESLLRNIEEEIKIITSSIESLRKVEYGFLDSKEWLNEFFSLKKSLFSRGTFEDSSHVLVDIGTGMNIEKAQDHFKRYIKYVQDKTAHLRKALTDKSNMRFSIHQSIVESNINKKLRLNDLFHDFILKATKTSNEVQPNVGKITEDSGKGSVKIPEFKDSVNLVHFQFLDSTGMSETLVNSKIEDFEFLKARAVELEGKLLKCSQDTPLSTITEIEKSIGDVISLFRGMTATEECKMTIKWMDGIVRECQLRVQLIGLQKGPSEAEKLHVPEKSSDQFKGWPNQNCKDTLLCYGCFINVSKTAKNCPVWATAVDSISTDKQEDEPKNSTFIDNFPSFNFVPSSPSISSVSFPPFNPVSLTSGFSFPNLPAFNATSASSPLLNTENLFPPFTTSSVGFVKPRTSSYSTALSESSKPLPDSPNPFIFKANLNISGITQDSISLVKSSDNFVTQSTLPSTFPLFGHTTPSKLVFGNEIDSSNSKPITFEVPSFLSQSTIPNTNFGIPLTTVLGSNFGLSLNTTTVPNFGPSSTSLASTAPNSNFGTPASFTSQNSFFVSPMISTTPNVNFGSPVSFGANTNFGVPLTASNSSTSFNFGISPMTSVSQPVVSSISLNNSTFQFGQTSIPQSNIASSQSTFTFGSFRSANQTASSSSNQMGFFFNT